MMAIRRLAAVLMFFPLLGLCQETAKLGSVEGTVVNSVTGEGIRRVDVVLRGSGPAVIGSRQEPTTMVTSSDAEGRFRFEGAAEGMYFIIVGKQGYVADRRSRYTPRGIRVSAAQDVTGLEYKLQPQAVITGRVVDDEGEPVQGVSVSALQRRYMNGKRRWMQSSGATTNDLGEFRIFNLPPGKVVVAAMPARRAMQVAGPLVSTQFGGEDTQFVQTFHPSVFEPDQATVIETKAGQLVSNADIQLRRGTVYKISGRVVDPEAQGQLRFGVSAMRTDDMMRGGEGASTRPDGSFEVRGVRPGTYILTATSYDNRTAGQRRLGVARVDVPGDVEGIVIEIKGGFKVSGTVSVQTAQGGEKVDLKAVNVMLTPAEQGMFFGPPPQVVVASDGTWTAENVIPGTYKANAAVRNPELGPSFVAAVTVGGEDYFGRDLDMTQGPVGPVRVVVSTNTGTISGRVDTSEGPGEGQAMAVAIPAEPKFRLVDQPRAMPVTQDGAFMLKGLRPGEYLVFVFDQFQGGALEDPEIFKQVESKGVRVKVSASQTSTAQVKVTPWPEEAMPQ